MRRSVLVKGPWRGIMPSVSPQIVPDGFLHDARGLRFSEGKIVLGPGFEALQPLPVAQSAVSELVEVEVTETEFVGGTHNRTRAVAGSLMLDCGYVGTVAVNLEFDEEPNGYYFKTGHQLFEFTTFTLHDGTGLPNPADYEIFTDIAFREVGGAFTFPGYISNAGVCCRIQSNGRKVGAYLWWEIGGSNAHLKLTVFTSTGSGAGYLNTYTVETVNANTRLTTSYRLRLSVSGRTLRAKAWRSNQNEPANWQAVGTYTAPEYDTGNGIGVVYRMNVANTGAAWDFVRSDVSGLIPCSTGTWISDAYSMDQAITVYDKARALLDRSTPTGTSVQAWCSFDDKTTWIPITNGTLLSGMWNPVRLGGIVPAMSPLFDRKVFFKIQLDSTQPTTSPAVHSIGIVYGVRYAKIAAIPFKRPITMFYIESRDKNDMIVYITADGIYLGDVNIVYDVTPVFPQNVVDMGFTAWKADDDSNIVVRVVTTDTVDWIILVSSDFPFLFRMNTVSERFEVWQPPQGDDYLDVVGGRHLVVFNDRLFFGDVATSLTSIPHAIAHYGVWGPFDNSYPTAGLIPITDIPGPVTGLALSQDFLIIFKPSGICVGQRNFDSQFPIVVRPRIPGIGCSASRTIVQLPGTQATCFLGTDGEFYVYDVSKIQSVSAPVRNYIADRQGSAVYAMTYPDAGEIHLIYPDLALIWNYREGWWSADVWSPHIRAVTPQLAARLAIAIDQDQPGDINSSSGYIDSGSGAITEDRPLYLSDEGLLVRSDRIQRGAWFRTAEIRFPKPYHLTRLEMRCRAVVGAEVLVRHTTDSGKSWSQWSQARTGDHAGTVRVFYDFVTVTEQIMFEVDIQALEFVIEDFVLDVELKNDQEEVTPLARDFTAPTWTGGV